MSEACHRSCQCGAVYNRTNRQLRMLACDTTLETWNTAVSAIRSTSRLEPPGYCASNTGSADAGRHCRVNRRIGGGKGRASPGIAVLSMRALLGEPSMTLMLGSSGKGYLMIIY